MSPLMMGSKQVKAVSAEELTARSGALEQAVQAGGREQIFAPAKKFTLGC